MSSTSFTQFFMENSDETVSSAFITGRHPRSCSCKHKDPGDQQGGGRWGRASEGDSAPQQGPVSDGPWSLEVLTEPHVAWWPFFGGRGGWCCGEEGDLGYEGGAGLQRRGAIWTTSNCYQSLWQQADQQRRFKVTDDRRRQQRVRVRKAKEDDVPTGPWLTQPPFNSSPPPPLWPTAPVRTYVIYRGDACALFWELLCTRLILMLPCGERKQLILSFLLQM